MPAYCQAISTPLAPPQQPPPPKYVCVCGCCCIHTLVYTNAHIPTASQRLLEGMQMITNRYSCSPFSFPPSPLAFFSPILQNCATPSGFLKKIHPPSRFLHIPAWVNGSCHTCLRSRADTSFRRPRSVSIVLSGKSAERCLRFRWRRSERTRLCMQTCLAHGRNMQKMNVNLLCRFLVCSFSI